MGQVVGSVCVVCGSKITFAGDGDECLSCNSYFHNKCISEVETCPNCRVNYKEFKTEYNEKTENEKKSSIKKGGWLIQTILLCLILPPLVFFLVSYYGENFTYKPEIAGRYLFVVGIVGALFYRGYQWAKTLTKLFTVIRIIVSGFFIYEAILKSSTILISISVFALLSYISAFLLMNNKNVLYHFYEKT